jgi:hypothetical protein
LVGWFRYRNRATSVVPVDDERVDMTKRGYTFGRHVEVGRRLAELHEELQTLLVEASQVYPLSSPQVRRLSSTCDRLSAARSSLDDAVYREHGEACAHVYYPAGERWDVPHDCETRRRVG